MIPFQPQSFSTSTLMLNLYSLITKGPISSTSALYRSHRFPGPLEPLFRSHKVFKDHEPETVIIYIACTLGSSRRCGLHDGYLGIIMMILMRSRTFLRKELLHGEKKTVVCGCECDHRKEFSRIDSWQVTIERSLIKSIVSGLQ